MLTIKNFILFATVVLQSLSSSHAQTGSFFNDLIAIDSEVTEDNLGVRFIVYAAPSAGYIGFGFGTQMHESQTALAWVVGENPVFSRRHSVQHGPIAAPNDLILVTAFKDEEMFVLDFVWPIGSMPGNKEDFVYAIGQTDPTSEDASSIPAPHGPTFRGTFKSTLVTDALNGVEGVESGDSEDRDAQIAEAQAAREAAEAQQAAEQAANAQQAEEAANAQREQEEAQARAERDAAAAAAANAAPPPPPPAAAPVAPAPPTTLTPAAVPVAAPPVVPPPAAPVTGTSFATTDTTTGLPVTEDGKTAANKNEVSSSSSIIYVNSILLCCSIFIVNLII